VKTTTTANIVCKAKCMQDLAKRRKRSRRSGRMTGGARRTDKGFIVRVSELRCMTCCTA